MKLKTMLAAAACGGLLCALPGCVYINGDADGHTAFRSDIAKPTAQPRDVTFSLEYKDDSQDHFNREGEVIRAIESEMQHSGMFRSVQLVSAKAPRGPLHYAYTVRTDGPSYLKAIGLGLLNGLTYTTLPVWMTYEADWSLTVYTDGEATYNNASEQERTYVQWLPCALISPYTLLQEGDINTRAVNYFLSDIQQKDGR